MHPTNVSFALVRGAAAVSLAVAANAGFAATMYSETWSAGDTNGWIGNTSSTVVVRDAAVGNPAGSLASRRDLSAGTSFAIIGATTELAAASGSYLGSPSWTISFDVMYDIGNFTDGWLRFRYQDSGFNGWHLDVADVFPAGWTGYSVGFNSGWSDAQATASGWVQEDPAVSWQLLMSDVYHPEIRLFLGDDNSALAHIDNFAITSSVPEPATTALVGLGLLGLGFGRRRKKRSSAVST